MFRVCQLCAKYIPVCAGGFDICLLVRTAVCDDGIGTEESDPCARCASTPPVPLYLFIELLKSGDIQVNRMRFQGMQWIRISSVRWLQLTSHISRTHNGFQITSTDLPPLFWRKMNAKNDGGFRKQNKRSRYEMGKLLQNDASPVVGVCLPRARSSSCSAFTCSLPSISNRRMFRRLMAA